MTFYQDHSKETQTVTHRGHTRLLWQPIREHTAAPDSLATRL
uniref:Uncharacterized protein n=1 Tax=Anguilla anguilla TaxID=7936 RepID=A0A0E9PGS3_ANGAN